MTPGMKQTLVIAGFGGALLLAIYLRGQSAVNVKGDVLSTDQVSFPVPASVSPLQSPLFAIPYAAPPTAVQTARYNLPTPLITIDPRDISSADNAGCCSECGDKDRLNNMPVLGLTVSRPGGSGGLPRVPTAADLSSPYTKAGKTVYEGYNKFEVDHFENLKNVLGIGPSATAPYGWIH